MHEPLMGYYEWLRSGEHSASDFRRYVHGIAQARFVIRRVFRIVDEQAKKFGLEPLQHQALIQIYGAEELLRINEVAERLDISAAFASRLVTELEAKELVERLQPDNDRRLKLVAATQSGIELLRQVDQAVHLHVEYFQKLLADRQRAAALGIFAFYVGASLRPNELQQLFSLLEREVHVLYQEERS